MGVISDKVKESLNDIGHAIGVLEYVDESGRPIKNKGGENMSGKKDNKVVRKGNKVVLQRPGEPEKVLRETRQPVPRQPRIRQQRISRKFLRISPRVPKLR